MFRFKTLYAKLTVHSGPHPVIVSGLGTRPFKHLQIGFPSLLAMHMVPGPQGLGSQGSGFKTHLEEVVVKKNKKMCLSIIYFPKSVFSSIK